MKVFPDIFKIQKGTNEKILKTGTVYLAIVIIFFSYFAGEKVGEFLYYLMH